MLQLPEIYAENIHRWLPELLYYCAHHPEDRGGLLRAGRGDRASLFALLRTSRSRILRAFAIGYIEVARGLPIVVLLYIVYFVPPQLFPDLDWRWFSDFTGAVVGLGLHGGAILAEVFRSGIEALHKGQREAAISLGMTPAQAMAYILMPQAARIVLPPVGNYAIGLLKDTSLCSLIGVQRAHERRQEHCLRRATSRWPSSCSSPAIYFAMSYPLSLAVRYMEWRLDVAR